MFRYFGVVLILIGISACEAGLQTVQNLVPKSNTKTLYGVSFTMNKCELHKETRSIVCHAIVQSNYRDRAVSWNMTYTSIQDDTGQSYPTKGGFGLEPTNARASAVLVADQPYNVTFLTENIDSRASTVRAVTFGGTAVKNNPNGAGVQRSPGFTLSGFDVMVIEDAPSNKTDPVPQASTTPTYQPASSQPVPNQQAPVSKQVQQQQIQQNVQTAAVAPQQPSITQQDQSNATSTYEVGMNRPFSDIGMQALQKADPLACQAACISNSECRAWTYVKPGIQGPNALCWMKNPSPAQVPDLNTVSGVITRP